MQLRNLIYGVGVLNPENKYHRIIRRGLMFAILAFIGQLVISADQLANPLYLPIVLAVLGSLEKLVRESLND